MKKSREKEREGGSKSREKKHNTQHNSLVIVIETWILLFLILFHLREHWIGEDKTEWAKREKAAIVDNITYRVMLENRESFADKRLSERKK